MNDLEKFLELPDVTDIEEEVFVSERLGKFKVRAMTATEHGEYMKRAKGKVSKNEVDFDIGKFNLLIVAGQTVYPDFSNADLLAKAKCNTPIEFIQRKLKAGEISELAGKICEISGFDRDINEDVEEAKN